MDDAKKQKRALRKRRREDAAKAVDEWRGGCIRLFAELEQSLVDTFDQLSENGVSQDINDPGFIKMRLQRLIEIAESQAANTAGKKLCRALRNLQPTLSLRTSLTHGSGRVLLDAAGQWRLSLRHCPPTGDRIKKIIGQSEAEENYRLLSIDVPKAKQRMCAFVKHSAVNSQTPNPADTPSA